MEIRDKKKLFLIGGVILAVLVAVVLVLALAGGNGGRRYEKHFEAAQNAYLRRDFTTALDELSLALEERPTEDAYLLMAGVYEAQGDTEQALRVLSVGASRVGGDAINEMSVRLRGGAAATPEPDDGSVTVAGTTFPADAVSVVLSGKGLNDGDLAALCRLSGLQNLSLADNAISDLRPVAALTGLSTLQLSDNRVSDLSALSGLGALKTLYLDGNPIQDFSPLYGLSGLRTLSMKRITVSPEALEALEQALPQCSVFADAVSDTRPERISLGGKTFSTDVTELNLGGLGLTDISALRDCRDLVRLDLRDNNIRDISPLVELLNLEDLSLWNNAVTDITPLMSLTKLRRLDVDGNQISDVTVLEYLPSLTELWLNNNTPRSFAPLAGMSGLVKLGLKNTGLDDAALLSLAGLTQLTELNVEENPALTMAGYETLAAALPRCKIAHSTLYWTVEYGGKTFRSDATELSAPDCGIQDLAGLEHFTALKRLVLDGNPISDLSPLSALTGLEYLSLRGTGTPEPEIQKLAEALPSCEIVYDLPEPEQTPGAEETPNPDAPDTPDPDHSPAPGPTPDPEAAFAEAKEQGAQAALSAAGTGSGYGILWSLDDPSAGAVRQGFIERAAELGLNVVADIVYSKDTTDFAGELNSLMLNGADVVFLPGDRALLDTLMAQARAMNYAPSFVQIG